MSHCSSGPEAFNPDILSWHVERVFQFTHYRVIGSSGNLRLEFEEFGMTYVYMSLVASHGTHQYSAQFW